MKEPPEIPSTEPQSSSNEPVSAKLRGEGIAYALQHMAQNLIALTYEPYLNHRIQKHVYERQSKKLVQPDRRQHGERYGTWGKNFMGEFASDAVGASALVGAELLIPGPFHAFTRKARAALDPVYDRVAHWVLADQKYAPDYAERVKQWKLFQERNLIRSAIIAPISIVSDVLIQKHMLDNASTKKVIFWGKTGTTVLTVGLGLIARLMFPEKTKKVDSWLSDKLVVPIMENGHNHKAAEAAVEDYSHLSNLLKNRNELSISPQR